MILTALRPYQSEALERALPHQGFALLPEQRTGKCLTSLAIVDRRKPDILFIVGPKKAVRVWNKQLKEHIHFDWPCQRVVTHYEAVCRGKKDRAWFRKQFRDWEAEGRTVFMIVDEGHRIKRRGTAQSRMIRSLGRFCEWRLLLTGTPIAQGRHDAWALFDFIMPGALEWKFAPGRPKRGQPLERSFQTEYLELGGFRGKQIVGYRNTKQFDRIFHTYSHRITLREAQIQSGQRPYRVKRQIIRFDLKPDSRRAYEELLADLKTEVRKKKISTPMVMTLISKLQQIAGGYVIHSEPLYDAEGFPLLTSRGKPKVKKTIIPVGREKMVELARVINREKKKLVICAQFTHEIEAISRLLTRKGRSWKIVSGKAEFDGQFNTDCVILQIRSGEAIDLAAAATYVFYSWNHSYINYEQAKFRILEFKTRQVNYIYLMANDTVDEEIYEAVIQKKDLATLVCDKYRRRRRETRESARSDKERAKSAST